MASPAPSPIPADPPMNFRGRPTFLTVAELEPLMRVCPSAEAYRAGFALPDADVDDVLRAAKDIENAQVYIDPAYPPSLDLSARVIRLLQVALDVQFQENDELINDLNNTREEVQDLEERDQRAQEELDRMRALRDREQGAGDAKGMQERNEDLARRLDDEYRSNDRMRQQRERDERRIEDLEYRLQRADDDLRNRDEQMKEIDQQLRRQQEEYTDLKQTHDSLRAEHAAHEAKQQIGDTMRQHEWKIERMVKENRALELQNVELRKQVTEVKGENIEVSEKIVLLDEEVRKLKAREAELEGAAEQLHADKAALLSTQEELRVDVADKVALLDSFEARFQRQFRSWEEERSTLQAQIEALRRGVNVPGAKSPSRGGRGGGVGSSAESEGEVQLLKDQLNMAMEKEVLLLEAYEQLELSVAGEIDKALSRQAEDLRAAQRRVDFLTQRVEEEREGGRALRDHQAQLEDQVKDAAMRNKQYEGGLYGLPQAVEEIHQLKDAVYKEQGRVRDLVGQINVLVRKVEDLSDENTVLRQKAGVGEEGKVDTRDVRMHKEATIAQLRSLNALLERQVADLEEERRKLRMEMKFRAKYHGQHALEMGLTPEQLLLLEQTVDDIKNGRSHEARLVDQLTHRIQFLELRLGEVMAYADIPPSMRPALAEFDPVAALTGTLGGAAMGRPGMGGNRVGGGVNMRAAQLQAIKTALIKSLTTLRELNNSLGQGRSASDKQHQAMTQQVISQLTDTEKAVDAILKDALNQAPGGGGGAGGGGQGFPGSPGRALSGMLPTQGQGQGGGGGGYPMGAAEVDAGYLADAMADELREHLRQMARQVADLQATVIKKESVIEQLMDQRADMEKKFGLPMKDRKADFVSRTDYEEVLLESASLKEQLVSCLEELAAREREATDLASINARYQSRMQTYSDQVKMLYREYAVALSNWKTEKLILDRKNKRLQEDADGSKAAVTEYARGMEVLSRGNLYDTQRELMDTVRRMAVVQIKHAKVARELEACNLHERALQDRVEELEQEVRDVSSTCRSRMRWLEQAADNARRRVEGLFRELQGSVPLAAHQMLSEKHARQQGELRHLVEEQAQQVVQAEELFRLRDDIATWMTKYDMTCDTNAELRERVRQLELLQSKDDRSLDLKLAQELVACRVAMESAGRRVQLVESERGRVQRTLQETQTHLKDVEDRLSQSASEMEMLRSSRAELERRFLGSKTKEEADRLLKELEQASAAAAEKHNDYANLSHRSEEAERKLEQAQRDRQRHLAEITNMRAALRDVSSHRESASVVGKLHEQLDHALAKESLARNALNRSELQRFEAEKELRRAQAELSSLTGRVATHQDQARWADKQRQEAQTQLDISLAGRTEAWKSKLWARKLQQLKVRNDAIADTLDLARRRIKKLEDAQADVQLKLDATEDISSLLGKGVSEVVRDAARLHEQLLQLRMERGKLQREEVLLREKVHYVERVNAELHELIEKYEAEFFQQQVLLEGDKATALAQARALQDDVTRLQERLAQLLASHDTEADAARKSLGALRVDGDIASRLKAHMSAANAGDREIMLKQIDALRAARQEAEHMRQEVHRLRDELSAQGNELSDVRRHHNDALGRLKDQSEALLYALNHHKGRGAADETVVEQMRAVAEATIKELKDRLKERQKALDALEGIMAAEQARMAAQHKEDRAEIERLNQCLFERNDASINNMKDVLNRIPRNGADGGPGADVNTLRDQLGRHNDELAALKARIEQQEAEKDMLERAHSNEVKRLLEDNQKLSAAVEASRRQSGPTRQQMDKLQAALNTKDDKLRLLRDTFKTLEEKLIDSHKKLVDEAMKHGDALAKDEETRRKEEEERNRLLRDLASSQAEISRLRTEVRNLREGGLPGDDGHAAAREQLQAAVDRALHMEQELSKTRTQLQKMKNAERTVMDLTTGMSVEAKRQIEELQKRIHVLERQNSQMKRTLKGEDAGTMGRDDAVREDQQGTGAAGSTRSGAQARDESRPGTADPAQADAAARSATAVAQWEEAKKLNKRIDDLRRKLALKHDEVLAAKAELERRTGQVAGLQKELEKQAVVVRDMQEAVHKAQAQVRPTLDAAKLREYVDKLGAAEAEADALRQQLAAAQAAAAGGGGKTSGGGTAGGAAGPSSGGGGDALQRDAEMFELKLQRDQAQVQVKRLKERIAELFGAMEADPARLAGGTAQRAAGTPGAASLVGSSRRGTTGGGSRGGAAGGGAGGAQEAELMSTITNLKAALEKATASTTPTTKFMAEVQRRKDAQQEAVVARQEADKLRAQGVTLQRMTAELQANTADLRRQLRAALDGVAAGGPAGAAAAAAAQIASLESLILERDSEVAALRTLVAQRDQQLAAAAGSSGGAPPAEVAALQRDLAQVRLRLSDVESENADLKAELNAFDPKFFDEIEDLKHEHYVMGGKVEEYERIIVTLSARLGQPPPPGLRLQAM